MKRTFNVVYDGSVLRPQEPLGLHTNGRYKVSIEEENAPGTLDEATESLRDPAQDVGAAGHTEEPAGAPRTEDAEAQNRLSALLLGIADRAVDFGISDFAEQHDHYLYGTPKR